LSRSGCLPSHEKDTDDFSVFAKIHRAAARRNKVFPNCFAYENCAPDVLRIFFDCDEETHG
jgi:hypothetical protein